MEGREPVAPAPERRSGAIGWGVALIAVGILWLLSVAGVDLRWELVLPSGLVVIGLLVLLRPRAREGGLIGLGVVVLVLSLIAAAVPTPAAVTAGERSFRVTDVDDLDPPYNLGAGELTLDLRELSVTGTPVEVAAQVTFGELVVLVPDDARIEGEARVTVGEVEHFGRSNAGMLPSVELADPGAAGVLVLDLRVGFGRIEVRR